MSGRRRTGGSVAIIADVYQKSVNRRLDREDERAKFDRRLQELGIEAALKEEIDVRKTERGNANVEQLLRQRQGFQQNHLDQPQRFPA